MEVTKKVPSLRFPGFEGDWEEKKLGEVVQNKIKGNTPDYENPKNLLLNNDFMENQAIPIYVGNDIDVKANDLLILWDGSQAGKVYTGFEGVLGSTFTAINFGSDASHLFIYNALSHNLSTIQRVWREGSGIPHVAKDFIKNYKIQLPSLPEQQKIADCLTAMDDTIEAQQQKVEQLQAYKKGLLQQLFSQTLRFPGFEGAWEITSMGKIADIKKGFTPKTDNKLYWNNGEIPWLSIADMNQGKYINSSIKKITKEALGNKSLTPVGTLIMSFKLSIGKLAILNEEMITNEAICHFYWKNNTVITEYAYYYLNTINIASFGGRAVKGVTLNGDSLNSIVIKLPSLPEQQKIADCLSTLDDVIELETQKLEQLRLYKKGLLQQLFV